MCQVSKKKKKLLVYSSIPTKVSIPKAEKVSFYNPLLYKLYALYHNQD